jgi:Acetyltransferase (GNAT) domain
MRTELLGVDDARWRSFLAGARHDFYHLPAYVALSASQERGEPAALYVSRGGAAMLLPLIIRPIQDGGRDATSPYGYPGPLLNGTDDARFMRDALLEGIDLLESVGIVSLFVRLHPLLNREPPIDVGRVVLGGETVSIDLTRTTEELWHQTRAGHRYEINRAIRAGRKAVFDNTWAHYATFKHLYRTTMTRVSAHPYYFFDDAYFDGLRTALGSRLRLCVVEADERVAAAALFVETCGIVQFHLSANDPAFARESLTKLILHFVRSWAKERGDRELHLGGGVGAVADSLLDFKLGFSPRKHPFQTLRVVVNEGKYARLVRLHERELLDARRLGTADGALADHSFFPAYRTPVGEGEGSSGAATTPVGLR